ncbi:MAG: c-type cytochrome [Tateyamaria sp.]|nr:c-type cytochrome [Tateyamaria sp.]
MLRAVCIVIWLASPSIGQDFYTLKGHGGPIMDIAVSPLGEISTASFDNAVGFWGTDGPVWLEGHRAAVNTVCFLNNKIIASGADDFTLWVWSLESANGRMVAAHTAKIADVAIAPDGQTLATASWDNKIGLTHIEGLDGSVESWLVDDMILLSGHRAGVNAIAFTQDGQTLYSASMDGTIRSWNLNDPKAPSTVIVKHGFGVNRLIVNDADGWLAYGAADGGTRMVDLNTGETIADFTLGRRPVLSMAYDPVTKMLAIGDGQGYIMFIDTTVRRITTDFKASLTGPIWALSYSPDGEYIHAGGIEDIVYSWPVAVMDEHIPMVGGIQSFLEDPISLPNGERQFKRKCSICHSLTKSSARKAGPSLYGLFGRKAGTVVDYTYSDTLSGSSIVWSEESVNALFDLGPDHFIPGTKMPMQRIVKKHDRDDLIDYLRTNTVQEEN